MTIMTRPGRFWRSKMNNIKDINAITDINEISDTKDRWHNLCDMHILALAPIRMIAKCPSAARC